MGSVSALIREILPAKVIIDSMVEEAARMLQLGGSLVKSTTKSKLWAFDRQGFDLGRTYFPFGLLTSVYLPL